MNGRTVKLSRLASEELRALKHPYSFEPDCIPLSEHASTVQLLIRPSTTKSAPSLRVLLPVDYPNTSVQLLNDGNSKVFEELMAQVDAEAMPSLSQLVEIWSELVDQCVKVKSNEEEHRTVHRFLVEAATR